MIDHLIFYAINDADKKIYILSGQLSSIRAKYCFLDYTYDNPMVDSSIADTFSNEFGNLIIDPYDLVKIIQKTIFPNFAKLNDNGLTYIIKVPFISNVDINRIHSAYRSSYSRNNIKSSRWITLKWWPLDDMQTNINQFTDETIAIMESTHLIKFLTNQYGAVQTPTTDELKLVQKVYSFYKLKKLQANKLASLQEKFNQSHAQYFKKYSYADILVLYQYTCESAYRLNSSIRSLLKNNIYKKWSKNKIAKNIVYVEDSLKILEIIGEAPLYNQLNSHYLSLYRGISFDPNLIVGKLTDLFKYSFNSTSTDIETVSNMFVPPEGSLFKIVLDSQQHVLSLNKVSHYSYEDEILLPPGFTFRVIAKTKYYNEYLKVYQPYYTLVLQNFLSYKHKLRAIKDSFDKQLNGIVQVEPSSTNTCTISDKARLKMSLINRIISKIIHIDYQSDHKIPTKEKLIEQIQLLLEIKSPLQKSFDQTEDIMPLQQIITNKDIISQYVDKYFDALKYRTQTTNPGLKS